MTATCIYTYIYAAVYRRRILKRTSHGSVASSGEVSSQGTVHHACIQERTTYFQEIHSEAQAITACTGDFVVGPEDIR